MEDVRLATRSAADKEHIYMNVSRILAAKPAKVISIGPNQLINDALALLAEHDIGGLVVTNDEDELIGIITERDIVRQAAQGGELKSLKVADVMTKNVIVGLPQDDLMSVAHTMTERRFRHLPIVDGRRLVGIVSIGDVLKAQRDAYRGQIDTLETQIMASDD
jgi:CBS domain-containing protein